MREKDHCDAKVGNGVTVLQDSLWRACVELGAALPVCVPHFHLQFAHRCTRAVGSCAHKLHWRSLKGSDHNNMLSLLRFIHVTTLQSLK